MTWPMKCRKCLRGQVQSNIWIKGKSLINRQSTSLTFKMYEEKAHYLYNLETHLYFLSPHTEIFSQMFSDDNFEL